MQTHPAGLGQQPFGGAGDTKARFGWVFCLGGMMAEKWIGVLGREEYYQVSDQGRVRSLRARNGTSDHPRNEPLVLKTRRCGRPGCLYHMVALGRKRRTTVHRLVLETFVGTPPEGHQAAHLDGDRDNNCLTNLKWATKSENERMKVAHGRVPYGENASSSKLTWEDVRLVRARVASGEKRKVLAEEFGVSITCIAHIVRWLTWNKPPPDTMVG